MNERLRFENVFCNHYGLRNINLTIFEGEILGIMVRSHTCRKGLMKLFSGEIEPNYGNIYLNGHKTALLSKHDAKKKGIGCIYRRSQLVPNMTIYENIFVNQKGSYFEKLLPKKVYYEETKKVLEYDQIHDISAGMEAWALSPAKRHQIEIAKASAHQAKVIVIDNITDRYSEKELTELKNLMLFKREAGLSFVFLTNHYMDLFSVADRVSVIRDRTTAAHINHKNVTKEELFPYITEIPLDSSKTVLPDADIHADTILTVKDFSADLRKAGVNFSLKKGEIFGILETDWEHGVALGKALYGRRKYKGEIFVEKKLVKINNSKQAIKEGIGFVDENEFGHNIMRNMGLLDNITLMLDRRYDYKAGLINTRIRQFKMKQALAELESLDLIEKYGIKKPLVQVNLADQMKIILAKWLCVNPKILIFLNPHIGFDDLDMINFCHFLKVFAKKNIAVLIISTNPNNLNPVCDRIMALGD